MDFADISGKIFRIKQSQTDVNDDQQICPSSAHLQWKGSARTSVNYWRHRVERTKSETGSTNPHLCARITYKGKRVRFSLETANKDAAASKAATIYRFLVENGWQETLKKYRPDAIEAFTLFSALEGSRCGCGSGAAHPPSKSAKRRATR